MAGGFGGSAREEILVFSTKERGKTCFAATVLQNTRIILCLLLQKLPRCFLRFLKPDAFRPNDLLLTQIVMATKNRVLSHTKNVKIGALH